jgi:outer membrane protein assembly factor BamB
MYVQLHSGGAAAFAAKDGSLLWSYGTTDRRFKSNTANIPTPIVKGNEIFFSAGYGRGGGLVKITKSGDKFDVEEIYFQRELGNKHGGVIWVGDSLYGDSDDSGRPFRADAKTGKIVWRKKGQGEGRGSVAVTYADGNLYWRYQNGVMALVPADVTDYAETSSFKIHDGSDPSWPHPVVVAGKLYLRDQDNVWCYDLKAE